ncbi:hypothetical protein [Gordonia sp. NB41Y]|uniref:hypothetical protein n=1 Tax=Gordonia sp. NB41Y TaxID=875808 RepID=UPI0002BFB86C|nr:hypothetical protein [Gordonia sp. NB41Y]EMP12762.1 hypothetical protein ISGA_3465 [Gordonia sp. NB41Y]WLP89904.1 hypothetical protein Q9K23_20565 [Gordonia sp. NB41Y]
MGEHEGPRDWRHIYKTRIRTSTAVLLVAFIVCSVVYGYTSQRYAAPETGTTSRVVNTTPREREYTDPPTTRSSSSSVPSSSSSEESSEPGNSSPGGTGTQSSPATSTPRNWLDDLPIPGFGTTTTTAPPSS